MDQSNIDINNLILNRNILYSINPISNEEEVKIQIQIQKEKEKEILNELDFIRNKENEIIKKIQIREKFYEKDIISKGNY
jgi:hypothetical protein